MIRKSRVKMRRSMNAGGELTRIECDLSSMALFCMAESSGSQDSPIQVALRLRNDSEVIRLREALNEFEQSVRQGDTNTTTRIIKQLNRASAEVDRRLGLNQRAELQGPATINIFSLPVSVPEMLRRPVLPPKHSGVLHRFASTGSKDVREIVARSTGIRDRRFFHALDQWVNQKSVS